MELEYMDNTKNDHYYLDKIKTDLAFIVAMIFRISWSGYHLLKKYNLNKELSLHNVTRGM